MGSPRFGLAALFAVAFLVLTCAAWARNTDVVVDSSELGPETSSEGPESKFGLPLDGSTVLGFNEDGDPAVSRQF